MLARALLVSFQQALRSIALTLFPLAFIALFAWATAGSSTGNTTDPIRASIWLWLGAHLVPFNLFLPPSFDAGLLSVLPLGAAVFPFLAMRSGLARSIGALGKIRPARIFFALWYLIFTTLAILLSRTSDIKPSLIYGPIFVLLLLLLAMVDLKSTFLVPMRLAGHLFTGVLGLALIFYGISLAAHFTIVKELTTVLQPGWVGGVLLLFGQILYLPNLALYSMSYLLGFGFSLGAGTHISPTAFTIHQIPAIPLLGGLPTGKHPLYLLALLVFILATLAISVAVINRNQGLHERIREFIFLILVGSVALAALSYISSGTLLTKALSPVGIRNWQLPAAFAGAQFTFLLVVLLIPAGITRFRTRAKN